MKANRLVPGLQPKGSLKATSVHRMQHSVAKHDWFVLQFTERNTGLQQVCRGPISGPMSGPSGSPRSPAEPHPPSLAWVETPLPLGPLPPPPGPLNAKHSKRAQGAVFNGTHSPVRSEPSSPPPGSPQRGGGHPAIAPGAVLHVRSRRVTTRFCAVGAKLRAGSLAKSPRAEWVGSQKFDSRSLHSLGQLPMRADESESVGSRSAT